MLKLLDASIICPIADNNWVNPTQVVPKKSRITVVKMRIMSWSGLVSPWVNTCIEYRKLNTITRKDDFPFPFLDQILESSRSCVLFLLHGYSWYYQIEMHLKIKRKPHSLILLVPSAFRMIPIGLWNAPRTFQRCMLSILSDVVEHYLEVIMNDSFVLFGNCFDECLFNLQEVLTRCEEKNFLLFR